MVWNLVPQFYYDLLAKVVPGGLFLSGLFFTIKGPQASLNLIFHGGGIDISFSESVIALLLSYFFGLLLTTISAQFTKKGSESKFKKQNSIPNFKLILSTSKKPIDQLLEADLENIAELLSQIRICSPLETGRLLKRRAECRMLFNLVIAMLFFALVNLALMKYDLYPRLIFEFFLLFSGFFLILYQRRMSRRYEFEVRSMWLHFTYCPVDLHDKL
jgi:hypothetical protein